MRDPTADSDLPSTGAGVARRAALIAAQSRRSSTATMPVRTA